MEILHSVIGINSDECNEKFIEKLPVVFSHADLECDLHMCMMGRTTETMKVHIPDISTSIVSIQSPAFNYSLAMNVLLKQISIDYPFATVILTDGWTVMSPYQIISSEFKNINWEKEFITVPTMLDDNENPFNIYSEKFHNAYFARIRSVTWKFKKNMYSPIIISKIKHITELECGLEEELFSEYSRLHLINQLKSTGLEERCSTKNIGLCLRNRHDINPIEQKDLSNITTFEKKTRNSIFIPSNYGTDWGDATKIGFLRKDPNKIPYWKLRSRSKITMVDTDDDMDYIEIEPKISGEFTEIMLKNCELTFDKNFKILIVANSYLHGLLSTTPLIKGIFKKWGPVDIVTDDILNPAVELIRSTMVDKIYSIDDFYNGMTNFNKYGSNIIRTCSSYNVKLPPNINFIEPLNISKFSSEKNYSIIDPCIEKMPEPYCNFTPFRDNVYPQTISVIISTRKKEKCEIWKDLSIVCSRLANNTACTIFLLSLSSEETRIDVRPFKIRKNVKIMNMSEPTIAGIMNSSGLVITPSDSWAAYMCWALKKNSILLDYSNNSLDFRPTSSMKVISIFSSKTQLPIQEIFEELVDKL